MTVVVSRASGKTDNHHFATKLDLRLWISPRSAGDGQAIVVARDFETPLPIDTALPGLTTAMAARTVAVLVAPPGAGKTTRVPLVLLDEAWAHGKKILVLEPRRLAARAAAARMASTLK
jgi:HrpA-like RNA helicase